jgi:glycerophosphoryl diester phosphodiesterase
MTAWPFPRVIAHRGGGTLAPENTLAALEVAARHGCPAVEFDVRLSAGGTPFLIHDATLERTTDGRGRVARTSDAALRTLDAGRWYGTAFAGEPLPTVQQAIERCLALGLWANVELKAEPGREAECGETVARVIGSSWRGSPPLLSSFSARALDAARLATPRLPRALLVRDVHSDWAPLAHELGCLAVHIAARKVRPGVVATARQAGLGLACYTVDDPGAAAKLFAAGVDAVFTDRPDRVRTD